MEGLMDQAYIKQIIPHRDPFLWVSRVMKLDETKIHAQLDVDASNPVFEGHFPVQPVFPGVLIVEALAQTGAILLMQDESLKGKIPFFGGIDECRFKRVVSPGETLDLHVEVIKRKGPIGKAQGVAYVNGELAAKCVITFAVK
jgi:3-hydroxyacyl-[acyl-carrier-protein] dehydratase